MSIFEKIGIHIGKEIRKESNESARNVKEKPLYHAIADELAKQIDSGKYPPGSRLPAERELAQRFGVSRVKIREAEIALQALGRISIKTGSGVYVAENGTGLQRRFPEVSAFELTEARALFESQAAALAAEQISDESLQALEQFVEVMSDPALGDKAREAADHEFHHAIAAASNNAAILHVIETMWNMRDEIESVKSVYDSVCSGNHREVAREHRVILDALRARDPEKARSAMRKHFRRLLEAMLDVTHAQAMKELQKQSAASRNRYLKNVVL